MRNVIFFSLLIFLSINVNAQYKPGLLKGSVINGDTGEPLDNCNVLIQPLLDGTVTNSNGEFEIDLLYGRYTARFSYMGFTAVTKNFTLSKESPVTELTIKLYPLILEEEEVTIYGKKELASTVVQKLEHKDIINIPTLYNDVMRSIKILPGVSSNNELSSGYNVRGGTFDENLIYLNGYEIFRPFLLRQGIEENQSLAHGDMVSELEFYNGGFPANYGDKMSSALEVSYMNDLDSGYHGTFRADLLNAAASLQKRIGDMNWNVGVRYAYPNMFQNELHTEGTYSPTFMDVQSLITYNLHQKSTLELFVLYAENRYDLSPSIWQGHFNLAAMDAEQVEIQYDGNKDYGFTSSLVGLKMYGRLTKSFGYEVSVARFKSDEEEDLHLTGDYYYSPSATKPDEGKEYLKSRLETADNMLAMTSYESRGIFSYYSGYHTLKIGVETKLIDFRNRINEFLNETGTESLLVEPMAVNWNSNYDLNSFSAFVQDILNYQEVLEINAGVRVTHTPYNDEVLVSPRAMIRFHINERHAFSASWGYYYQPPFFYELRMKTPEVVKSLKAQKSIHYTLGWDYQFQNKVKFQAEVYYKKLSNLIPFYLDQVKLEYGDKNSHEGYAYGFDIMFQGELVKGMQSWLGYSYLNTKERNIETGGDYRRRILDQSHTLQIFIQDKMPALPDWQTHVRFLVGSGYLEHVRVSTTDPETGNTYITVSPSKRKKMTPYIRADMGLSFGFRPAKGQKIIVVAEVQNIFNNYNLAGHTYVQAWKDVKAPLPIDQIYSKRFFNLGVEYRF